MSPCTKQLAGDLEEMLLGVCEIQENKRRASALVLKKEEKVRKTTDP